GEHRVFIGKNANIDKWYQKQAKTLFQERLDYWYSVFDRKIPYPSLTIRKMTSRWGVCNSKLKKVTLNLELMKRDLACLDYVIVHELSHFKEMNHSNKFWEVVEANYPNYKKVRKIMKDY
ncbi:MAG: M48 family metallopeptidase, partial [Bacilli bacterium]|nr:M48 family metallopeptidase [Bacilli bacterium]